VGLHRPGLLPLDRAAVGVDLGDLLAAGGHHDDAGEGEQLGLQLAPAGAGVVPQVLADGDLGVGVALEQLAVASRLRGALAGPVLQAVPDGRAGVDGEHDRRLTGVGGAARLGLDRLDRRPAPRRRSRRARPARYFAPGIAPYSSPAPSLRSIQYKVPILSEALNWASAQLFPDFSSPSRRMHGQGTRPVG
jgi:hypothetical protein